MTDNNKLLKLLEEDCTYTQEQLASMADMPLEDVKAAIKRYEEEKIVLGYKAIVDWDRTQEESVTALIEVKVTPQRNEGFDRVAERIYQYDEVESVYLMSGPDRRRGPWRGAAQWGRSSVPPPGAGCG